MKLHTLIVLAILTLGSCYDNKYAFAQGAGVGSAPGVVLQEEGVSAGRVIILNCVGTAVTCTKSGATGVITVTGGTAYNQIQDEGSNLTQRTTVNFTGAGVSCADSGGITVCTIAGAAGASWTQTEIDFGVDGVLDLATTVVDASVIATSKIMILQSGIAATGRQADENELDNITCTATPGTGTFSLKCFSQRGAAHGLYKVNYTIN